MNMKLNVSTQTQVVSLIAEGLGYAEIGRRLNLSRQRIEQIAKRAGVKLKAKSLT